tara:strand:+ start:419 stop:652 length:234 start_codon:yes stop_codon:yes gene_type:complete
MKCKHHPDAELEVVNSKVHILSTDKKHFVDIEYCTECFLEHERCEPMKHDLISEEIDYYEDRIDNYIQDKIKGDFKQ